MRPVGAFCVAADHPSLPGHFPGRRIVPGVVLLDEVLTLILGQLGARSVAALPSVKFLHPVLPEEVVTVFCGDATAGRVGFHCIVASRVVLRGSVQLGAEA
jgi:3-hydroxyacyl-[acyl-carrier-protein] dehydratase